MLGNYDAGPVFFFAKRFVDYRKKIYPVA